MDKPTIHPPRTGGVVDAAAAALAARTPAHPGVLDVVRVRIRQGAYPATGDWAREVYLCPGTDDTVTIHTSPCQGFDAGPHDDCITLDLP